MSGISSPVLPQASRTSPPSFEQLVACVPFAHTLVRVRTEDLDRWIAAERERSGSDDHWFIAAFCQSGQWRINVEHGTDLELIEMSWIMNARYSSAAEMIERSPGFTAKLPGAGNQKMW